MPFGETIAALATPPGTAALALLRVSGPLCAELAAGALSAADLPARTAKLLPYRNLQGEELDRVIALSYPGKASYTGEPLLEISCHGNPLIVRRILDDLHARGCRPAEPGEFTRTAFLHGKLDLAQAEAVGDLIHARSEAALAAARRQLSGAVGEKVQALADQLLAVVAELEAYIDFPEEDLPPESETGPAQALARLGAGLDRLIATARTSTLLHEGASVVLAGAPNAGKSSLLNALLGRERVLVSAEPGTTRDYVEDRLLVGPYLVRLTDTAGLHPPGSELEGRGMEKTYERLQAADCVLLVIDRSAPPPVIEDRLQTILREHNTIVVENKTDQPPVSAVSDILPELPHQAVSARTGEGLDELKDLLHRQMERGLILPGDEEVMVSARHARALDAVRAAVQEAREKLRDGEPAELAASDLRAAMDSLGEIVGRIDHEEVLDRIFARFCIGK